MLHGKSSLLSTLHLLYSFVSPDYFWFCVRFFPVVYS
jgi:hypothetical protein